MTVFRHDKEGKVPDAMRPVHRFSDQQNFIVRFFSKKTAVDVERLESDTSQSLVVRSKWLRRKDADTDRNLPATGWPG